MGKCFPKVVGWQYALSNLIVTTKRIRKTSSLIKMFKNNSKNRRTTLFDQSIPERNLGTGLAFPHD